MNKGFDARARREIALQAEAIKRLCMEIAEGCNALAECCNSPQPVAMSGKSRQITATVDSAEKALILCNELGRGVFSLAQSESGSPLRDFFPVRGMYGLERVGGEKMYLLTLPYLMYSKLMHQGSQFKVGKGRFSLGVAQESIDAHIASLPQGGGDADFFNGSPLPPIEAMDRPYLFFLYHFSTNRRALDADNIETKRVIDLLDGTFFRGDDSTRLMTSYVGVRDTDDFTEVIIAEQEDAHRVLDMVGDKMSAATCRIGAAASGAGKGGMG
jgi:hypothetical protein